MLAAFTGRDMVDYDVGLDCDVDSLTWTGSELVRFYREWNDVWGFLNRAQVGWRAVERRDDEALLKSFKGCDAVNMNWAERLGYPNDGH